jgi:rubrerythrin
MFDFLMMVPLIMFVVVLIFFIFMAVGMFTGKTHARMMKRNIKTLKTVTDTMGDDMKDLVGNLAEMKKDIYQAHGDTFREVASMEAEIEAEKTRAKAQAIKDVFGNEAKTTQGTYTTEPKSGKVVCQNCGSLIDSDSMYCKICGKRPF